VSPGRRPDASDHFDGSERCGQRRWSGDHGSRATSNACCATTWP